MVRGIKDVVSNELDEAYDGKHKNYEKALRNEIVFHKLLARGYELMGS